MLGLRRLWKGPLRPWKCNIIRTKLAVFPKLSTKFLRDTHHLAFFEQYGQRRLEPSRLVIFEAMNWSCLKKHW